MMKSMAAMAALLAALTLVAISLPDLRRYHKIRTM